jgi:hypothetical protein
MARARNLVDTDLFRSYWDDGLLDLLCGLALLVMGIGWASTRLGSLAVLQAPLWIVLWAPLRKRIVEPRAGFVRFSPARREHSARDLRWTLALGVGAVALVAATVFLLRSRKPEPVLQLLAPGLPAALVALGAGIGGLLTGARRFHAYGLALLAGGLATVALAGGPAPPLAAGGLLVSASGAILLTRFVRASREHEERTSP